MIVLIDKQGHSVQSLQHFFGDQMVYFSDYLKGIAYINKESDNISSVLYVYDRDGSDYFYNQVTALREGNTYSYPISVIYSDHALLSTISEKGYDDAIHTDALATLGVRKLKATLEWRATYSELAKLRLDKEYYNERDELTGLPNQRKIIDLIDDYLRHCQRHSKPASFLSIDMALGATEIGEDDGASGRVDTAVRIDRHDREILKISSDFQALLFRSIDVLGRIDDSRFFIILPETDRKGAGIVKDRYAGFLHDRAATSNMTYTFKLKTFEFSDWKEDIDLQQRLISILTHFDL